MDFLRMEGEMTFVSLLPASERRAVFERWYRGGDRQLKHLAEAARYFQVDSSQNFRSNDHLGELYQRLKQQLAPVREAALDWKGSGLSAGEIKQMHRLSQIKGLPVSHLPEMSVLVLKQPNGETRVISLISNNAHSNVAELFREEKRRLPKEDTLLAINGIAGAYPNAILTVDSQNLPNFVDAVSNLDSQADLVKLLDRYGVRRTSPEFWKTSDAIHAVWRKMAPQEAAVLDYSRLDNL
jgi:hypothetical protein